MTGYIKYTKTDELLFIIEAKYIYGKYTYESIQKLHFTSTQNLSLYNAFKY